MSSTKAGKWPRDPSKLEKFFPNKLYVPTLHLSDLDRRKVASLLLRHGFLPRTVIAYTELSPKIITTLRNKACTAEIPFSHSEHRRVSSERKIRHSDHDYLLWRYFRWQGPWLPFLAAMRSETGIRIDELLAFYMYMLNPARRYDLRPCPACSHHAPLRPRDHGCPACLKSGRAAHKYKRKRAM